MDKKTPGQKAGKLDTTNAKRAVLALAVTSTLGFWAIFARVNRDPAVDTGNNVQASNNVPPLQVEETQPTLNLPPMPTLIPPLTTTVTSLGSPVVQIQPQPILVTQPLKPLVLKPSKIFLGGKNKDGAKPGRGGGKASDPVTSSGSSK
jgi:hypothetical protein